MARLGTTTMGAAALAGVALCAAATPAAGITVYGGVSPGTMARVQGLPGPAELSSLPEVLGCLSRRARLELGGPVGSAVLSVYAVDPTPGSTPVRVTEVTLDATDPTSWLWAPRGNLLVVHLTRPDYSVERWAARPIGSICEPPIPPPQPPPPPASPAECTRWDATAAKARAKAVAAYAVAKRTRNATTRKRAYGVVRVFKKRDATFRGFMKVGLCGLKRVDT